MTQRLRTLALALLASSGLASAQWTSLNFPDSQRVEHLAFGTGGALVAVSQERIYTCSRLGAPWKQAKGLAGKVRILSAGGALYAGNLYKSTDNGATWLQLRVSTDTLSLEAIGFTDGKLWAANVEADREEPRLYRSSDAGKTWSPYDQGLGKQMPHTVLDWNGMTVAGTRNGLFRLDAATQGWVAMAPLASYDMVHLVALTHSLFALSPVVPVDTAKAIYTHLVQWKQGADAWTPVPMDNKHPVTVLAAFGDKAVVGSPVDGRYSSIRFYSEPQAKWLEGEGRVGTTLALAVSGDTLVMGEDRYNFLPGSGGAHAYRLAVPPVLETVPKAPHLASLQPGATWVYDMRWSRPGIERRGGYWRTIRYGIGNDVTPLVFSVRDSGDLLDSAAGTGWTRRDGVRDYQVRCSVAAERLHCDDRPAFGHLGMARLFSRRSLARSFSAWFVLDGVPMDVRVDQSAQPFVDTTETYHWNDSLATVQASWSVGEWDKDWNFEEALLFRYNGKYVDLQSMVVGARPRSRPKVMGLPPGAARYDALGRPRAFGAPCRPCR